MAEKKHSPTEDALLALSASLFNQALACADYFEKKCGQPVTPEQFAQIVREFVFVFIQVIDRYSFEMYGHERRSGSIVSLVALLRHFALEGYGEFIARVH